MKQTLKDLFVACVVGMLFATLALAYFDVLVA